MHTKLLDLSMQDFNNYQSLPMIVYVTSFEGNFVRANKKATELFSISSANNNTINSCYRDSNERENILTNLKNKKGDLWEENQFLHLTIEKKNMIFKSFSKPYFDVTNTFLGSLCILISASQFSLYADMDESLPIGIFTVDRNGIIVNSNDTFNELFCFVEGEAKLFDSFNLFDNKEDFKELREELLRKGKVQNKELQLKRNNGSLFTGKIDIHSKISNGDITQIKGFIQDVTFSDILNQVPIGLYKVVNSSDNEVLLTANENFAHIYGFEKAKDCEGKMMDKFHKNSDTFEKFKSNLLEADRNNEILKNYPLEILTKQNELKEVIVSAKILKDKDNNIKGRVGLIYDVSNDLHRRMTEWEKDYAAFLHIYSSRIGMIRNILQNILESHTSDLVTDGKLNVEKAFGIMKSMIGSFKKELSNFNVQDLSLKGEFSDFMNRSQYRIAQIEMDSELSRVNYDSVRDNFRFIRIEFDKLNSSITKNDAYKSFRNYIVETLRYSKLLSINDLILYIDEVYTDIDTFSESILHEFHKIEFKKFNLNALIYDVKRSLIKYSEAKNVEVKIITFQKNIMIQGDERLLYNVLYNIVHNAVKYSWAKREQKDSWVSVDLKDQTDNIEISIENWGVAIKQEEIRTKEIFRFGRRGTYSSDRKRGGSGIGLWFSQKIVLEHNGEIIITSDPIGYNSKTDYAKPFITTVKIILPKQQPNV